MTQISWFEALISLVCIHLFLLKVFSGKIRGKILIIVSAFPIIAMIPFSLFPNNGFCNTILSASYLMLSILMPLITVKNISKGNIFYVSFLFVGLSSSLTLTVLWIASAFQASLQNKIVMNIATNCFLLIVCILIVRNIVISKSAQKLELIPKGMKVILLVSIWLSESLAHLISTFFYQFPSSPYLIATECLVALLIILVGVLCPLLIANSVSGSYYKTVSSSMERQISAQLKHYERMSAFNKDIRDFKHNFKNMRIGLQRFLSDGDVTSATEYLHEFDKTFQTDYILFETGNRVADALLSEKQEIARKIHSEIRFEGTIPTTLITPMDICTLLGNALDNAIEACEKLPEGVARKILISSAIENRFLFLKIQNPMLQSIIIQDNTIVTTKKDKRNHGIGLSSIRGIAEKYAGEMRIYSQEGMFILDIDLDLNIVMDEAKSFVSL